MRKIKFRGKDILHKSWQYGSLAKDEPQKAYYIIDNEYGRGIDVDENTVGQYTGLKDKNGKEIYEGDIVKVEKVDLAYIYYDEDRMAWGIKEINEFYFDSPLLSENVSLELEVIGNIYDNPDLLEKGAEK